MKAVIGGERLGSGNKMTTELRNYSRSTHNLSELWQSTMAPGVLYPFLCKVALNGDTFDIDLNAMCRTIPTQGPLFGSFKMQLDVFNVPMRLYSGILHNNPLNLGMNMNQVFIPKIHITTNDVDRKPNENQFSNSCLAKYLGISGIGKLQSSSASGIGRKFNAIPFLAYYDIFKNYYANKQETNAYVIAPRTSRLKYNIEEVRFWNNVTSATARTWANVDALEWNSNGAESGKNDAGMYDVLIKANTLGAFKVWARINEHYNEYYTYNGTIEISGVTYKRYTSTRTSAVIQPVYTTIFIESIDGDFDKINLTPFILENIDTMRMRVLAENELGYELVLNDFTSEIEPYNTNWGTFENGVSYNKMPLNGLCVKTYQSDMFNNWVQTEWIDGDNGIAALTAVDTSSGSFTMDALNLQSKLYNMLNRVAVAGGTWEDWQEAVYSVNAVKKAETPIYVGGLSKEVVFEEVVSTAESTDAEGNNSALGTLGGRGTLSDKHKGGKIIIKVNEPSIIMGIISLTPRISYSQGNEWYMTDLDTYDDLHKPALDGIGFEDLIGERMAWFDTGVSDQDEQVSRNSYGKLPAWINYMTSVDKCFGEFADEDGKAFMVLNRNYEEDTDEYFGIKDVTTYIDPSKFNYAFAYTELQAQNFWVSIKSHITARRIMSAKIIPNL